MKKYIILLIVAGMFFLFIIMNKEGQKVDNRQINQKSVEKYNINLVNTKNDTVDTKGTVDYSIEYFLQPGKYVNFRLGVETILRDLKEKPNTSIDNFDYIVNSYIDIDDKYREDFLQDYQQLMINVIDNIIDEYITEQSELLKGEPNSMHITYFDYYTLNAYNYIFCNLLYLMDNEIDYPYDISGASTLNFQGSNGSANFVVDKDLFYQNYIPQYNISADYVLSQNEILLNGLDYYLQENGFNLDSFYQQNIGKFFESEIAEKFNYVIYENNIYLSLQSIITFIDLSEKYKLNNNINLNKELNITYEYLQDTMK